MTAPGLEDGWSFLATRLTDAGVEDLDDGDVGEEEDEEDGDIAAAFAGVVAGILLGPDLEAAGTADERSGTLGYSSAPTALEAETDGSSLLVWSSPSTGV